MNLIKLVPLDASAQCGDDDDCPAVYVDTESEDAVVQGERMTDPGVELPAGEVRVVVPKALLRSLASQLARI